MPRADDRKIPSFRDDDIPGSRGAAAARLAKSVAHGTSGGHSPASRLVAAAARQAMRQPPLDFDHNHFPKPQRAHPMPEYHEYPKWVHPDGEPSKRSLIVKDRAEEETALGGDPVIREAEERARLIKVAEVKEVRVDKRWSLDNLRAAIVGAGHDADLDPFK